MAAWRHLSKTGGQAGREGASTLPWAYAALSAMRSESEESSETERERGHRQKMHILCKE